MEQDDDTLLDAALGIDPDSPADQALVWLSRLATGEADAATLAEFAAWRDSDSRNESALADARRLWLLIGGPLEARYAPAMSGPPAVRRRARKRWRPLLATAAGLALAVGLGAQWLLDWRYDAVTGVGEQRTIVLDDGSTMWLNTASAADIEVDDARRHVRLVRGEAYFDVADLPDLPFTVDAGRGRIEVLGTTFGVRSEGGEVTVTVQRGRVQVGDGNALPVIVGPDRMVRVHSGDWRDAVEAVNAEQALSWRTGRLQFENRPIGEVLAELKRYDRRMVVVGYPDAGHLRVSSIVDLARIDEWYDTLGQSLPVEVRRIGPLVWIRQASDGPLVAEWQQAPAPVRG